MSCGEAPHPAPTTLIESSGCAHPSSLFMSAGPGVPLVTLPTCLLRLAHLGSPFSTRAQCSQLSIDRGRFRGFIHLVRPAQDDSYRFIAVADSGSCKHLARLPAQLLRSGGWVWGLGGSEKVQFAFV
ncbi:hypothetical protein KC19_1G264500 [Ceratodon purpureus]|uniref:Uncharacterized protein n=1 Tax=Ceratodon purpureus TaxID=3225 RepID=A0A8T0J9J7_CERPU|nr:hypothetical protein KC19_1G264500 [Ceratodon purpureus]